MRTSPSSYADLPACSAALRIRLAEEQRRLEGTRVSDPFGQRDRSDARRVTPADVGHATSHQHHPTERNVDLIPRRGQRTAPRCDRRRTTPGGALEGRVLEQRAERSGIHRPAQRRDPACRVRRARLPPRPGLPASMAPCPAGRCGRTGPRQPSTGQRRAATSAGLPESLHGRAESQHGAQAGMKSGGARPLGAIQLSLFEPVRGLVDLADLEAGGDHAPPQADHVRPGAHRLQRGADMPGRACSPRSRLELS